jgi:hypothetical protein
MMLEFRAFGDPSASLLAQGRQELARDRHLLQQLKHRDVLLEMLGRASHP